MCYSGHMEAEQKRLAALKEELRKDMEAVERVERLIASKNGSLNRPDDRQMALPIILKAQPQDREVTVVEESEEADPNLPTLIGTISQIINADRGVRWTTQKVLSHLGQINYPLKSAKPIFSVGQSLSKLVKQKKIILVRKGTGSTPNLYRGKPMAGAEPETEGPSQDTGGDIKTESSLAG
jgi:hypothetical protein